MYLHVVVSEISTLEHAVRYVLSHENRESVLMITI